MTTTTTLMNTRRGAGRSSYLVLLVLHLASALVPLASSDQQLVYWEPRNSFPGEGRHHPITFANETHGFVLTGSTRSNSAGTSDILIYDAQKDVWTDLTSIVPPFPGVARSFGYGVVLNVFNHTKAYLGFGSSSAGIPLKDFWEWDMVTYEWRRLQDLPGPGRRHPAMVLVKKMNTDGSSNWRIHVGLGDGSLGNYNDWYIYDIETDEWIQTVDFPGSARHHPFYFGMGDVAYAGLGHSSGMDRYIERDWYRYSSNDDGEQETWHREDDFASYNNTDEQQQQQQPVTTEARVAGTQFAIELPPFYDDENRGNTDQSLSGSLGFVLSGDGDDHGSMETGEFHVFVPPAQNKNNETTTTISNKVGTWHPLPPHPGHSRWAPGSFVLRGTAVVYFLAGYDRVSGIWHSDVWRINLSPLFAITTTTATDAGSLTDGSSTGPVVASSPSMTPHVSPPPPTSVPKGTGVPSTTGAPNSMDHEQGAPTNAYYSAGAAGASIGSIAFAATAMILWT